MELSWIGDSTKGKGLGERSHRSQESVCPPRQRPCTVAVEDHLPLTVPLTRCLGSGSCPLVWGCCLHPLSAPHSGPAPTSAGPPQRAPCLRTGERREGQLPVSAYRGTSWQGGQGQCGGRRAVTKEATCFVQILRPFPCHTVTVPETLGSPPKSNLVHRGSRHCHQWWAQTPPSLWFPRNLSTQLWGWMN